MKNYHKIIFILILVFSLFTRFAQLGQIPSGLNWDEISHGYNAYSILQTGKDQWGIKWPIFNFRAYGDYPTTFNLYLTIPSIKLFGLNAFSIRLPSAIFGLIFVLLIFFFSQHILKNTPLALLCMFMAAISPWSLFPSRAVFQSNFSQVLLLLGIYFFITGLKKPKRFILSSILFGLSMYSYHNARIITPILIPTLVLLNLKNIRKIYFKNKTLVFISLFILISLTLPNLINLFSPTSVARNRWVGIINPNSINLINEQRRLFEGPIIINRLIHNKVVYFTQSVFVNYLNLFNPIPLFFQGSQNYQFNPPNTGLLYAIFLPFFYIGLIKIIFSPRYQKLYFKWFIVFLILLLPSAITIGDFPSIRATIALPFYFIFIAIGFNQLNNSKLRIIRYLIIVVALFQFINYLKTYLSYNQNYSSAWQYGYQQVVNFARSNYDKYDQIYITKKYGEPHEFFLFYWPWNPAKYQSDPNLKWDYHSDWYWVDRFDKFTFLNDWDIPSYQFPKNSLLITSPDNYPQTTNFSLVKSAKFLDGSVAFDIIAYD